MKLILFFLLINLSLQADLYDRNKYNLDFRPQERQHPMPQNQEGRQCPCDPGDPQCPCEIDEYGNYHRVD